MRFLLVGANTLKSWPQRGCDPQSAALSLTRVSEAIDGERRRQVQLRSGVKLKN
jgi:hypothetical protein